MVRSATTLIALTLLVGCSTPVEGTVKDGLTGQPVSGAAAPAEEGASAGPASLRLLAKAVCWGKVENNVPSCTEKTDEARLVDNAEASITCLSAAADVGADGKFRFDGLCLGASAYQLNTSDNNLFIAENGFLDVGFTPAGPVDITVFRAPPASGIFRMAGADLEKVPAGTDVRTETIYMNTETVLRPESIPEKVPLVAPGDMLVITGQENVDNLKFHSLVNSAPRRFGNDQLWVDMNAWAYLDTAFTDDKTFTRTTVTVDESKVKMQKSGDRVVKYIPADAVPAGRYVLMKDGETRGTMVDMGASGEMPKAPEPPAEPEKGKKNK